MALLWEIVGFLLREELRAPSWTLKFGVLGYFWISKDKTQVHFLESSFCTSLYFQL